MLLHTGTVNYQERGRSELPLSIAQQSAEYGTLYLYVGAFAILIIGFVASVFVVARLISPSQRSWSKGQQYETAEARVTDPWRPFPVRYYIFALLFLIFDVEALFLFPWAVIYDGLGLYGFLQMVVFVGIITLGLLYEWKKGALKWV